MAQEDAHLSDAGLALGLSLGGASDAAHHNSPTRRAASPPCPLTLSMPPDEATASGGGGVMKRERVEEAAALRPGAGAAEDDDDGSARKKLRLTKEQSALLEDRFKEHSTLNPKQKVALAKQLNLRPRQVEVWFQNRRASRARRTKLKQTEVDCEFLKRCCDALTEENRRLQRELRALKFAVTAPPPPFYTQTQTPPSAPPASTTACATRTGPASRRAGPPPTATCSTPSPTPPPASAAANRARTVRATSDTILPSSRFFIWGPGNT